MVVAAPVIVSCFVSISVCNPLTSLIVIANSLSISDVSGLQTEIDTKQDTITGAATTIVSGDLSENRVVITDASGKITQSSITSTELGYLDNANSNIQQQLNDISQNKQDVIIANSLSISDVSGLVSISVCNPLTSLIVIANSLSISDVSGLQIEIDTKQDTITGAATTIVSGDLFENRVVITDASGKIAQSSITSTELGYLDNANSNIQQQLNDISQNKQDVIIANSLSISDVSGLVSISVCNPLTSLIVIANSLSISDVSGLQIEIDTKQDTITGAATTIVSGDLFENRVVITDASGKIAQSSITSTELGYLDNANSNIQQQLNDISQNKQDVIIANSLSISDVSGLQTEIDTKQDTITGAATTIVSGDLFENRVVITDASGKIAQSSITSTELGYLDNANSNIQQQLNDISQNKQDVIIANSLSISDVSGLQIEIDTKQDTITGAATTIVSADLSENRVVITDASGKITQSSITSTELGYLDNANSNIQQQLNDISQNKQDVIIANSLSISDVSGLQIEIDTKQDTITGAATTIVSGDLSENCVVITDASGKITQSSITSTELGYLDNANSNIQQQLNDISQNKQDVIIANSLSISDVSGLVSISVCNPLTSLIVIANSLSISDVSGLQIEIDTKQDTITGAATTIVSGDLSENRVVITDASGKIAQSSITSTELGYLDNANSNIQQQLNDISQNKQDVIIANSLSISDVSGLQTEIDTKQDTITGAATTIVSADLSENRVVITDASGKITQSSITSTELGYLDNANSNIQQQLNDISQNKQDVIIANSLSISDVSGLQTEIDTKQDTITGAATTIVSGDLSENRVVITDSSGKIAQSSITSTELGYLDNASSNIQQQLNDISQNKQDVIIANSLSISDVSGLQTEIDTKQDTITGAATTIVSGDLSENRVVITDASGKITQSSITSTELGYLDNANSNIQQQLNDISQNKQDVIIANSLSISDVSGLQTEIDTKQDTITGAATTIVSGDLSENRVVIIDANGKIANSSITTSELETLNVTTLGRSEDGKVLTQSSGLVTVDGSINIIGDLIVRGTTTTLNSNEVDISDANIRLGVVTNSSNFTADTGGIIVEGGNDGDKTFQWLNSYKSWTSSENIDVVSGKSYKIGGTDILTSTTLTNTVVNSSLTSVGTLNGLDVNSDLDIKEHNGVNKGLKLNGTLLLVSGLQINQLKDISTDKTIQSQLNEKQSTIGTDDLVITDVSGLTASLASKQPNIGTNDLVITDVSGLQTALNSNEKSSLFVSGVTVLSDTSMSSVDISENLYVSGNTTIQGSLIVNDSDGFPIKIVSEQPTTTGNKGEARFDNASNKLYINDDGSSSWKAISGGSSQSGSGTDSAVNVRNQTFFEILTQQPAMFTASGNFVSNTSSITLNWHYDDILANHESNILAKLAFQSMDKNKSLPYIDKIYVDISGVADGAFASFSGTWVQHSIITINVDDDYNTSVYKTLTLNKTLASESNVSAVKNILSKLTPFDVRIYGENHAESFPTVENRALIIPSVTFVQPEPPAVPVYVGPDTVSTNGGVNFRLNLVYKVVETENGLNESTAQINNAIVDYSTNDTLISSIYNIGTTTLTSSLSVDNKNENENFDLLLQSLHAGTKYNFQVKAKNTLVDTYSDYSSPRVSTLFTELPSNLNHPTSFNTGIATTKQVTTSSISNGSLIYINTSASQNVTPSSSSQMFIITHPNPVKDSDTKGFGKYVDSSTNLVNLKVSVNGVLRQEIKYNGFNTSSNVATIVDNILHNSNTYNFFTSVSQSDFYLGNNKSEGIHLKGLVTLNSIPNASVLGIFGVPSSNPYTLRYQYTRHTDVNNTSNNDTTHYIYVDDLSTDPTINTSNRTNTVTIQTVKYTMGIPSVETFDLGFTRQYNNINSVNGFIPGDKKIAEVTSVTGTNETSVIDIDLLQSEIVQSGTYTYNESEFHSKTSNAFKNMYHTNNILTKDSGTITINEKVYSLKSTNTISGKSIITDHYHDGNSYTRNGTSLSRKFTTTFYEITNATELAKLGSDLGGIGITEYSSSDHSQQIKDWTLLYINGSIQTNASQAYPTLSDFTYNGVTITNTYDAGTKSYALDGTLTSDNSQYKWIVFKIPKNGSSTGYTFNNTSVPIKTNDDTVNYISIKDILEPLFGSTVTANLFNDATNTAIGFCRATTASDSSMRLGLFKRPFGPTGQNWTVNGGAQSSYNALGTSNGSYVSNGSDYGIYINLTALNDDLEIFIGLKNNSS